MNHKAVQYDNDKFTTWIDLYKSVLPSASKEIKKFYKELKKNKILPEEIFKRNNPDTFFKTYKISGESFKEFREWLLDDSITSKSLGDWNKHLREGTEAAQKFSKVTDMAKTAVASLGSTLASMAINYALGMVIGWIDDFIHRAEIASEKADEIAAKSKKIADSAKEEAESLEELINKYEELAQSETQDATTRSEILSIQDQITEMVGHQADSLDLVNGKLNEELATLKNIHAYSLKEATDTAMVAYSDAVDSSEKAIGTESSWGVEGYEYTGSINQKVQEALGDYIIAFTDKQAIRDDDTRRVTGEYIYSNMNLSNKEKAFETQLGIDISDAAGKAEVIREMIKRIEAIPDFTESSDEFYKALIAARDYYDDYTNEVTTSVNNLLDIALDSAMSEEDVVNSKVNSIKDLDNYYNNLVSKLKSNNSLEEAINNGDISDEDIQNFIKKYIAGMDEFSAYYSKWIKSLKIEEVSTDIVNKLGLVGKEWIDSLSEEDKSIVYQISCNYDTAEYTLEEWTKKIEEAKADTLDLDSEGISFAKLLTGEDGEATAFADRVNTYVEQVTSLQNTLETLKNGEFEEADLVALINDFPELAKGSNDLNSAIGDMLKTMNQDMFSDFLNQFGELETEEDVKALENYMDSVLKLGEVVGDTAFSIDITAESTGMENLYTAMKESVSSTGLTAESVKNLRERYSELEKQGYDVSGMFEKTEHGIHLNTKALRQLEAEYEKQKKQAIETDLSNLKNQYASLTEQIDNCTNASNRANLYQQRANVLQQIEDTSILAAQYTGLTSAFYKWEQAQAMDEEGAMYDNLTDNLENIKELYDEGLIGTEKFRTAVQLMTDQDVSNLSAKELVKIYEEGYPKMKKYFKGTEDGVLNFLHNVKDLNSEWVKLNPDGSWDIDFGIGDDVEVAKALGINVESVQIIMRKLSDYGFDINLDSIFSKVDLVKSKAEDASKTLLEMGKTDMEFNFSTTDLEEINKQLESAKSLYETFRNEDTGKINLSAEGAQEAKLILEQMVASKQALSRPDIFKVDTSNIAEAEEDAQELLQIMQLLQEFWKAYEEYQLSVTTGIDIAPAQNKLNELLDEIQSSDSEFWTKLNVDRENLDTTVKSIEQMTPELMVNAGLDATLVDQFLTTNLESEITVKAKVDETELDEFIKRTEEKQINITTTLSTESDEVRRSIGEDGPIVDKIYYGTSRAHGTPGDKELEDGVAVGGELGKEMLIRGDSWSLIGEKSAEVFNYKRGDIILNDEQVEQLEEKGYISHGQKRGKLVGGGSAFSRGTGTVIVGGQVTTTPSGRSDGDDEFEETYDWIEVMIDRIERAIKNLDTVASSVYKTWSERNKNLVAEIGKVREEINLQQAAYSKYMELANSVGLSEEWASKVRNGELSVGETDNEELAEKIEKYREWYEKAIDCRDAIYDLNENLSDLYQTAFDNVVSEYEAIIAKVEHTKSLIDEKINQLETAGYLVSVDFYKALIETETQNISKLQQEKAALLSSLSTAVNSGTIAEGSEAWNEMKQQINDVTLSLEQANTALLEYQNSIRETEWQIFDLLQDRISQVTTETDFLIELMSKEKNFEDNGDITGTGQATLGLHGTNYNVYMAQAEKYKNELLKINEELAKDPYNQTLIDRKYELIQAQQESILAAENEKQSIIDLVTEGIETQISALEELIEKYKETQNSARDLYQYERDISEKTENIANLEKQLLVYQGSNSEEDRAKVQTLNESLKDARQDLEDTQRDKQLEDEQKMLDALMEEYSTLMNQRADNTDALISDVITYLNENSASINQTLTDTANSVGYTLSDTITNTWNTSVSGITTVLTTYGDSISNGIINASTTLSNALNAINTNVLAMVEQLSQGAKEDLEESGLPTGESVGDTNYKPSSVPETTTSTSTTASSTTTSSTQNSTTSTSSSSSSTSDDDGFFIYKKDSYPKDKLNKETSIVDRLKYWNFDSSFASRKMYYGKMGLTGVYIGSESQNINMLKWMKVKGYSKGAYNLSHDQLAWTEEHRKPEAIIRASDGAILQPLYKQDSVLNPEATKNMYNLVNDPVGFVRDLSLGGSVSNLANFGGGVVTNHFELDITLPSVSNVDEFITEFQHSKKFEKMVQAMTIDQVAQKGKLAKFRI